VFAVKHVNLLVVQFVLMPAGLIVRKVAGLIVRVAAAMIVMRPAMLSARLAIVARLAKKAAGLAVMKNAAQLVNLTVVRRVRMLAGRYARLHAVLPV
jgi:hypothetical protein